MASSYAGAILSDRQRAAAKSTSVDGFMMPHVMIRLPSRANSKIPSPKILSPAGISNQSRASARVWRSRPLQGTVCWFCTDLLQLIVSFKLQSREYPPSPRALLVAGNPVVIRITRTIRTFMKSC